MKSAASESLSILPVDIFVFLVFLLAVVGLGLIKSRSGAPSGGATSESYFLAGRGLKWWLIGISIIAANISSEQFVGMSGNAADFGLAVASYEWMAAVVLVVVAFCFLPYFLRTGIFTIPHFLEHRYNSAARAIMAIFTMAILIGVSLTGVIYAGALTMSELFMGLDGFLGNLGLVSWSLVIGLVAALYVCVGGLKASAWADLIQGVALVLAGAIVSWLAVSKLGSTSVAELAVPAGAGVVADDASGLTKFVELNKSKLSMFLPASHNDLPWTALLLGLWIPNFYYWGLNQYITQRVLGSASLREGQKGIVFAAAMKLIVPFVIVVPGIIAFNLYSNDLALAKERANDRLIERVLVEKTSVTRFEMTGEWKLSHPAKAARLEAHNAAVLERTGNKEAGNVSVEKISGGYKFDASLNLLIKKLLPEGTGLKGFILAALLGAIVSSLAAVLNAASTIFTIDVFQKHVSPHASQAVLVRTGRVAVVVFALVGCVLAPQLDQFKSIFKYIQEFQGYISPGILAVFVFGLLNRRAPGASGVAGLLLSPVFYGLLSFVPSLLGWPEIPFLNRMAACFFAIILVMLGISLARPLAKPVVFETNVGIALESSRGAKVVGAVVVAIVAVFYVVFSPLGLAS